MSTTDHAMQSEFFLGAKFRHLATKTKMAVRILQNIFFPKIPINSTYFEKETEIADLLEDLLDNKFFQHT
jgi:hypothetical protein